MEKLEKVLKKLKGSILIIGYDDNDKMVKELRENKDIIQLYTLNNKRSNSVFSKNSKKKRLNKSKTISIKKLKKELKKDKFDYILCNFEVILPFFRSFVKNSILVADKNIFMYVSNDDYDYEEISKRYTRYGCEVVKTFVKTEALFEIKTENIKIPFIKKFLYWFRDVFYDIVEFVGNIMIG